MPHISKPFPKKGKAQQYPPGSSTNKGSETPFCISESCLCEILSEYTFWLYLFLSLYFYLSIAWLLIFGKLFYIVQANE